MIETVLESTGARALGWALVNFAWQGGLIAACLGGLNALYRQGAPEVRYRLACAALVLMLVSVGASFHHLYGVLSAAGAPRLSVLLSPGDIMGSGGAASVREAIASWLDRYLAWAVGAWTAGVVVLTLRLAGGWLVVRRLKRATEPVGAAVEAQMAVLRRRLSVTRPVQVLRSSLVYVPVVAGWIKPAILLPASALSGLRPDELEAVVAHELSHIRRLDFLANAVQTAAETLLFFHPAVWWVSRRIRVEREQCCDDAALEACGHPATYARALVRIEESRPPGDRTFALRPAAIGALDGALLSRVARILDPRAARQTSRAARVPGLGLAVVLLGGSALGQMGVTPGVPTWATDVALLPFGRAGHVRAVYALREAVPPRTPLVPADDEEFDAATDGPSGRLDEGRAETRSREAGAIAADEQAPAATPPSPRQKAVSRPGKLPSRTDHPTTTRAFSAEGRFALGLSGGLLRSTNQPGPLSPSFEVRSLIGLDPLTSIEVAFSYAALRDQSTFAFPGPDGAQVASQARNEKQTALSVGVRRAAGDGWADGFYYGLSVGLIRMPINRVIGLTEDTAEAFDSKGGYFIQPRLGYSWRTHKAVSFDVYSGLSFSKSNGLAFVQPLLAVGINTFL